MDRLAIPLLLPVAVTAIVVMIIVGIGSLLLWFTEIRGEDLAVAAALAIAGAVLIGCYLAERRGPRERVARH
jgi:hypothetical protein